jgi:hypothetical protein
MEKDKKGYNSEDMERAIMFVGGVKKSIETFIAAKSARDKLVRDITAGYQKIKRQNDAAKRVRLSKYFREFKEMFIHTPIDRRQILIDNHEGIISALILEAKIEGNQSKINEYETFLNMIIREFIPLINKMKYVPKKVEEIKTVKYKSNKANSFNINTKVSFDQLNNARLKLIEYKFISSNTTPKIFKSVFSTKVVTQKVDWREKGTLYYFIHQLLAVENLFSIKVKEPWKETAASFTVKGEAIDSNKFRKDKPTKSEKKIENLKAVLSFFKVST